MGRLFNPFVCLAFVGVTIAALPVQAKLAPQTENQGTGDKSAGREGHPDDGSCPFQEISGGTGTWTSPPEIRNGTGMVGVFPCWKADEDNDAFNELSDFYAHWSVRELPIQPPAPRAYERESRSAFVRLFVGREWSMVGSLRIDLHDPDTTFVVPLATFSYRGLSGKGQTWSTNLVSDDQTLDFFRIGPTTSAKITVSAAATTTLQVQAASTVLNVLSDLASIASPGGALVTALNRDALQQTSRTLDNALSSIWGQNTEESHATARQLSEWYPGARFIIQLTLPKYVRGERSTTPAPDGKEPRLTRWYELTLSCPRRSIFISFVECKDRSPAAAAKVLATLSRRVTAQQVLSLKVQNGVTLQQFASNHDWYARFLRAGDNEAGNQPQSLETQALAAPNADSDTKRALVDVVATPTPPPVSAGASAAPAAPQAPPAKAKGKDAVLSIRSDSDYSAFCSSIVNSLYNIGLSRLDAQIGLWAIVTGSSDFVGIEPKFQSNDRCTALLPLAGTKDANAWAFAVGKGR